MNKLRLVFGSQPGSLWVQVLLTGMVLLLVVSTFLIVRGVKQEIFAAPAAQSETTRPQLLAEDGGDLFLIDGTDGSAVEIFTGFQRSGSSTTTTSTNLTYPGYAHAFGADGTLYALYRGASRNAANELRYFPQLITLDFSTTPPTQNLLPAFISAGSSPARTGYGLFFLSGTLYAAMNTNAAIYELDPTSGAELNRTCSSLGAYNKFAVVNDVLYAGLTNNTALYQVDLENCTESVIGEAGIRWGPDFNSIYSISGHDGVLYGIGVQVNLPRDYVVVTIDTSTGIATEVSSTDSANSPVENESITGRVLTNIPDDFFIDTSGMSACVTSNAVHQGRMENSSGDFGGDFLSGSLACLVESDDTPATLDKYPGDDARSPANIFSFEMASGRGVDITINPNTQMLTSIAGQYGVRIRSGGLDGPVVTRSDGSYHEAFTIYNVSLGSNITYYLEVFRYGIGGGSEFSVNLTYNYIQPPTPTPIPTVTPIPTPTPRVQTNEDVRIFPNPNDVAYAEGGYYQFATEGAAQHFPVKLRIGNTNAFSVTSGSTANCDVPTGTVGDLERGDTFYLHVCDAGGSPNSLVELLRESDDALMAKYSIHVRGETAVSPERVPAPTGASDDVSERDVVGLTILVAALCEAIGISCDAGLVKNTVALVGSAFLGILPTLAAGGRVSTPGIALGVVIFTLGMMLGYLLVGLPLWMPALAVVALVIAAGMGLLMRVGRVNF